MGFGVQISDSAKLETIRNDRFVRLTIEHTDASPGETSITFPVHLLPSYITAFRALAANLGLPLKASWDQEAIAAIMNHDGVGRPSLLVHNNGVQKQ